MHSLLDRLESALLEKIHCASDEKWTESEAMLEDLRAVARELKSHIVLRGEDLVKEIAALRVNKARLEFIATHYANAIHYCCRVDGDNWNADFVGTLDATMARHAARKVNPA